MAADWQTIAPSNTSLSCLSSPDFEPVTLERNITYCAYKMSSIQLAQVCCNYYVQPHPQDDCTFICPGATGNTLEVCLAAVMGTSRPNHPGRHNQFSSNATAPVAQMMCYDPQGYAYPNISAGPSWQQGTPVNATHTAMPSHGSVISLDKQTTVSGVASGAARRSYGNTLKLLSWPTLAIVTSAIMILNG